MEGIKIANLIIELRENVPMSVVEQIAGVSGFLSKGSE